MGERGGQARMGKPGGARRGWRDPWLGHCARPAANGKAPMANLLTADDNAEHDQLLARLAAPW
jgi:hypothetical protein